MKTLQSLLSLLFLLTLPAWAGYSNPVGIWDIEGKTTLRAEFSGLSLPAPATEWVDTAQFHGDGSHAMSLLSGLDGHWEGRKKYRIAYQADQINDSLFPGNLVLQIHEQFLQLTRKTFGDPLGSFFSIQDVRIKSYTDSGLLTKHGLKLQGVARVRAIIDFIPPGSKKKMKARVNFRFRYQGERASAPSECCSSNDPLQNLADSQAFLSENAKLPGVRQTPSGLQYRVIEEGSGNAPAATDTVTVNYRGTLPSGQRFDGNAGVTFRLDRVIAGWTEGLQLMREGAYYRFYIPPELAYGARGAGRLIKPNSALIFDVQLLNVGGG